MRQNKKLELSRMVLVYAVFGKQITLSLDQITIDINSMTMLDAIEQLIDIVTDDDSSSYQHLIILFVAKQFLIIFPYIGSIIDIMN